MAVKSRKKSLAAKRRSRTASGQFKKMKRNPHTKTSRKRAGVKAAKTRARNRRAVVRAKIKKCIKRARSSVKRKSTAIVRQVQENPMKRRRGRRSVRKVRESEVYETMRENPHTKASRKRAGKKAAATRARNKRKRSAAARKASRSRTSNRTTRAIVPSVVRRRVGGKSRAMPGVIRIQIATPKSARRSYKRRASTSKKGKKRGRKRGRKSGGSYTSVSRQLPAYVGEGMMENPLYGGALENPLTGGEMASAFISGGIGFVLADVLDRFLATKANGSPVDNTVMIDTTPSIGRIAAQAGLSAASMAGAYFVRGPMLRSALHGLGIGAGIHLFGQVVKTFVLAKLLKNNATGQRLFPEVIGAQAVLAQQPGTTAGLPVGVGRTPYGQLAACPNYQDVGPRAGVGAVVYAVPPQAVTSPFGCAPCTPEAANAALAAAYQAAVDDNSKAAGCGGGCGGGSLGSPPANPVVSIPSFNSFPE